MVSTVHVCVCECDNLVYIYQTSYIRTLKPELFKCIHSDRANLGEALILNHDLKLHSQY